VLLSSFLSSLKLFEYLIILNVLNPLFRYSSNVLFVGHFYYWSSPGSELIVRHPGLILLVIVLPACYFFRV
jgi:hypothetical protein